MVKIIMVVCNNCGEELNNDNWYESNRIKNYKICKKCTIKKSHKWRTNNLEKSKKNHSGYYQENKERLNIYNNNWRKTHPTLSSENRKRYRDKIRLIVLTHYSGNPPKCADPYWQHKEPYTDIRALTIDHVRGGGKTHLRNIGGSSYLYRWLIKNKFPEEYQVLCMNCQFIKRIENKEQIKPVCLIVKGGFACNYDKCKEEKCLFSEEEDLNNPMMDIVCKNVSDALNESEKKWREEHGDKK